jgi:hypothetical protein
MYLIEILWNAATLLAAMGNVIMGPLNLIAFQALSFGSMVK